MTQPPPNRPTFAQIPDYKRLCEISEELPDLDPEVVRATAAVRGVGTALAAALEASLVGYGLSEGRLRMLGTLLLEDGPLAHCKLAERTSVTRGTITGLVDSLERDGLVRRRPDEHDRRVTLVELTAEGRALLDRVLPGHLARLSRLMSGLTRDEQKQLVALLLKVHDGLSALRDPGSTPDEAEA